MTPWQKLALRIRRSNLLGLAGINIALRGLSLGAQFLLLLIMARALGPATFGTFTLIQATRIIAVLLLGFEFSAYSRREIVVAQNAVAQTRHIRDQIVIAGALGLNAVFIAYGASLAHTFPADLIPIVAVLILLDLISQEGIRILYALQRVLMANFIYFVRSSAWVVIIALIYLLSPRNLTLNLTLDIWAAFSSAAILIFLWSLRAHPWKAVLQTSIDWQWIGRGFRVAAPFFISTAFLNILSYLPRYMLFYMRGLEETGLFGLYTGIAVGIVNLVSTITIPEGVAKAVYSFNRHGETAFSHEMKRLWSTAIALSMFLAACLLVAFPFILPVVGSKNYPMDWLLLILVILSNIAQVASMVAQTSLYARHRDREILISTLSAGTLSVAVQYVLTLIAGMHGLAIAMALSTVMLTLLFLYFERKASKHGDAPPIMR
jgi:O-antigen/teichoic acid export membrane protein